MTDRIMPAWVQTLGAILRNEGIEITSRCSKCGRMRKVDVAALAARVGADYSLINRRSRCRIDGCRGWWRFWYSTGTWTWRMWDDATEARWLSYEVAKMNRAARGRCEDGGKS